MTDYCSYSCVSPEMSFVHFGIIILLFRLEVTIAQQDSLVFAQVFFRSGFHALEAGDVYNKTYNDTDLTDSRIRGDLTKDGKQQGFELGQLLKKRYEKLVPTFSLEKVKMESSIKNRSLESAELVLAGMFPPKDFQTWKGELDGQDLGKIWIPIPVQSNDKITIRDSVGLTLQGKCPVFENFTKSTEFLKLLEDFNDIIDEICNLTQCKPPERVLNALRVSSALVLESSYPGSEPEWANENLMKNASDFYWALHSAVISDFKVVQLSVGWLLEGIIAEMEQAKNAKENHRTFHGYSMHVDNLNALLASLTNLSALPVQWPSFGAYLTVELYKTSKNGFRIKAFFWDNSNSTENEVAIADCKNPCSLKKFKQISKKYFVDDWEEACGLSRQSTTVRPPTAPTTAAPIVNYVTNPADKALTGFLVIFVLLFLASVGVLIWMRKKMRGGAEGSLLYSRTD